MAHIQQVIFGPHCGLAAMSEKWFKKTIYNKYCVKMVKLLCEAVPTPTDTEKFEPQEILGWPAKSWENKARKEKAKEGPWSPGFVDMLPIQSYSDAQILKLVSGIMFPYALVCDRILPGYHKVVWGDVQNLWNDEDLGVELLGGKTTNVRLLETEKARKRKNYEGHIHSWTNKRERKEKSKLE